jgi:hypothetical protein
VDTGNVLFSQLRRFSVSPERKVFLIKRIDNKHSVTEDGTIIKTSNGAPIPDHEPKILFRGRDRLAIPMLQFYLELCLHDGCTLYQEESMRAMIQEFEDYKKKFGASMKQPGSTSGR